MPTEETTQLLIAWSRGDAEAGELLATRVYSELKRLAFHRLRGERGDHTLQPTALVNETFLRLFRAERIEWRDRAHFFEVAGRMMRRILVDHARQRGRQKRGGGLPTISLDQVPNIAAQGTPDLIALDEALRELELVDPQKAKIVELHFFAGLSVVDTARVIGSSARSVTRHWRLAKTWLLQRLES